MYTSLHLYFLSTEHPESGGEKYISLDELKKAVKSMKSEKFKSVDMKVSSVHVCVEHRVASCLTPPQQSNSCGVKRMEVSGESPLIWEYK